MTTGPSKLPPLKRSVDHGQNFGFGLRSMIRNYELLPIGFIIMGWGVMATFFSYKALTKHDIILCNKKRRFPYETMDTENPDWDRILNINQRYFGNPKFERLKKILLGCSREVEGVPYVWVKPPPTDECGRPLPPPEATPPPSEEGAAAAASTEGGEEAPTAEGGGETPPPPAEGGEAPPPPPTEGGEAPPPPTEGGEAPPPPTEGGETPPPPPPLPTEGGEPPTAEGDKISPPTEGAEVPPPAEGSMVAPPTEGTENNVNSAAESKVNANNAGGDQPVNNDANNQPSIVMPPPRGEALVPSTTKTLHPSQVKEIIQVVPPAPVIKKPNLTPVPPKLMQSQTQAPTLTAGKTSPMPGKTVSPPKGNALMPPQNARLPRPLAERHPAIKDKLLTPPLARSLQQRRRSLMSDKPPKTDKVSTSVSKTSEGAESTSSLAQTKVEKTDSSLANSPERLSNHSIQVPQEVHSHESSQRQTHSQEQVSAETAHAHGSRPHSVIDHRPRSQAKETEHQGGQSYDHGHQHVHYNGHSHMDHEHQYDYAQHRHEHEYTSDYSQADRSHYGHAHRDHHFHS